MDGRTLAFVALAAMCACKQPPSAGAGDGSGDGACGRLAARFAERFADPAGERCGDDEGCAWVMPIGAIEPECGKPCNAGTAAELEAIASEWAGSGCGRRNECDSGKGEARCVDGRCSWLSIAELRALESPAAPGD